MKKFLPILPVLIIIYINCEKSTNPVSIQSRNWHKVFNFQEHTYRSFYFQNKNNGWTVGQSGKIMHTINGGASWNIQNSGTTEDLFSVSFCNSDIGWVVGRNNTILQTSDGGNIWKTVTIDQDTTQMFFWVEFTDKNNGWIFSNHGKVFKTENCGNIWKQQLTWDTGGAGLLHFVDNEIGFIMPSIGNILYRTYDSGLNWSTNSLNIDMSWERDMFFINQFDGWICNDRSASSMWEDYASLFHTKDSGETWELVHTFNERFLMKVYFLDKNNGWVAGSKIHYTSDGGNSWVCQTGDISTSFTDLQFIDLSTGYALDYSGALYKFYLN